MPKCHQHHCCCCPKSVKCKQHNMLNGSLLGTAAAMGQHIAQLATQYQMELPETAAAVSAAIARSICQLRLPVVVPVCLSLWLQS